jgi:hypothetical protein
MQKLRVRYQIVLSNMLLTILFYSFLQAYFDSNSQKDTENELSDVIEVIFDAYIYIIQYLWINILWIAVIVLGIIKKNKELFWGGLYSLVLSTVLIVLMFSF